jgi:hypothetical protein
VTVDAGDGYQPLPAPATGPRVLSGQVMRSTVRDGAIVKRTPLAAITVKLLRAAEHDLQPGRYRDTGRSTTTGTDGRWAFTLEASTPSAFYRAVAPVLAATSGPVAVAPAA